MRRFVTDESGAIAVMGILIGAVLAAVLFHLMNCGFGILWREHAQDAADATAYEAAVWNARGMNIVVTLNIFIALVMAVLICWRIIIIFSIVAMAACAIACPFQPEFCSTVQSLGRAVTSMFEQDPKISGRVYQTIKLLHDGQKVVAAATPILGTLSSIQVANQHGASFGVGFGTQLLPTLNLPAGKAPSKTCKANNLKKNTSNGSWGDLLGKPVSLPWQDKDDVNTLCGQAGIAVPILIMEIVGKVFKKMGIDVDVGQASGSSSWTPIFKAIFSAPGAAELFCGQWGDMIDEALDDKKNNTECKKGKGCDAKEETRNKAKDGSKKTSKLSTEDLHWADIWGPAGNGGLFLQSWSFVKTERKYIKGLDRVLGIANFVPGGTAVDTSDTAVEESGTTVAEAEMYFDCKEQWSGGGCRRKSPWTRAWRARLRRVHDPVDFIVNDIATTIVGALYGALESKFAGAIADKFGPVKAALDSNGGRLIQTKAAADFDVHRQKLRRVLVPAVGNSLPVRSAAAWVNDEANAGVPQIIH